MKHKVRSVLVQMATWGLLLVLAVPATATFPGKNGRIAFVSGPDVYTMKPDGSDVKQLTNFGPDDSAYWESWSADGKQIVFNKYQSADSLGQLWLMSADGNNQRVLLADTDFDDERPSFTPDGSAVVFSRCRLDIEACALFQIELNGGTITALTDFAIGVRDLSAEYSVENRLAFTGIGRQGIICAIELSDSPRFDFRRLTPAPLAARHPDWSPDGRRIAFSSHCSNPQNEEIWVETANGDSLVQLTNNGNDYVSGPHDFFPSWSPEGDAIVFERDSADFSSTGIFVMKADGTGRARLLELGRSSRTKKTQRQQGTQLDSRAARRLKQIEEGGTRPQWGVATH